MGQSHLCAMEFRAPSGELCATCPTLADALTQRVTEPTESALAASHGDCHDCCTLTACEDDPPKIKAAFGGAPFELCAILPQELFVSVPVPAEARDELPPSAESYLPHGPPSDRTSRAPPASFA